MNKGLALEMAIVRLLPSLNVPLKQNGKILKLPQYSKECTLGTIVFYRDLADEELTAMAANNDKGLISFIYDEYAPAIYGFILRRVKVIDQANEILCRTFIDYFACLGDSLFPFRSTFINLHRIASGYIKKSRAYK